MNELVAIVIVLAAALAIRAVVTRILRHLAIFPKDEAARSKGFRDVLSKLEGRRRR